MTVVFSKPRDVLPTQTFSRPASVKTPAQADLEALQAAAAAVLASPQGQMLLDHLLDRTLRASGFSPFSDRMDSAPDKIAIAYAFREGQNAVVRHLLSLAAQGQGDPGFIQSSPL